MAHALHGNVLQHLHLLIGKRTGRSHNDRLARVNAQWIEILHRGNGEATVVGIADALKLNLLPSLQALLYEHLRSEGKGRLSNLLELLLSLADTRAETAQRISRTNHDRIAYLAGSVDSLFHVLAGVAYRHLEVNLVELLHEEVAVFGVHDSFYRCAENLHTVFLEHTTKIEFCTHVEASLSTPCEHDAVGALLLDDFSYKKRCHWQEINLVCDTFTCLNRCNIGIDEDGTDTLLTQSLEGLRTGIVKLTCLADFQSTGTQYEDFLKLFLHHYFYNYKFVLELYLMLRIVFGLFRSNTLFLDAKLHHFFDFCKFLCLLNNINKNIFLLRMF